MNVSPSWVSENKLQVKYGISLTIYMQKNYKVDMKEIITVQMIQSFFADPAYSFEAGGISWPKYQYDF